MNSCLAVLAFLIHISNHVPAKIEIPVPPDVTLYFLMDKMWGKWVMDSVKGF